MPVKKKKDIDEYRAKRDFSKTPEPAPEPTSEPTPRARFVVHRHEARRLHYDLRLEMEGVLKSWAIPRGFNYDPKVKKLAVRTEDHPMAYEEFSGVIPKGEYGGGTMTIWDRGHFSMPKVTDGPAAVQEGKLEFLLYGKKLRGEWHLVRTRTEKDEWILFKARDVYVRQEEDRQPFFELNAAIEAKPERVTGGMIPTRKKTSPFSDPAWLFEVELEGLRCRLTKRGESLALTRDGEDPQELQHLLASQASTTESLVREIATLRADTAVLDGVFVVNDEKGRPSKTELDRTVAGQSSAAISFYAFDLLYYEEWDIRAVPLLERKTLLSTLIPAGSHLLYVDHVRGRGEEFAEVTESAGLHGILAKQATSAYSEGASESWLHFPLAGQTEPRESLTESLEKRRPPSNRRVLFTNLDKVFWPEQSYTKGDLIQYYAQVAETLLPYLHERPCHMLRYPDGIHGKSFYQKDAPDHTPDWIETERIASDSRGEAINYIICNDRDTLLYMANLASIDIHPWFSRRNSQDEPDWAIFDLDPDGSPFPDVVRIARTLGRVLRGIGLRPYVKTSGATGIHVYVPVVEGYSYEHTKQFCEAISIHVAAEHKDIATVERVVSRRRGKVYIDFLQNRKGQTIVPAYVVRPQPHAPVSAPLDWDEVDLELTPTQFTMKNMMSRLEKIGDLFAPTLTDKQDLLPAIEKFQETYLKR